MDKLYMDEICTVLRRDGMVSLYGPRRKAERLYAALSAIECLDVTISEEHALMLPAVVHNNNIKTPKSSVEDVQSLLGNLLMAATFFLAFAVSTLLSVFKDHEEIVNFFNSTTCTNKSVDLRNTVGEFRGQLLHLLHPTTDSTCQQLVHGIGFALGGAVACWARGFVRKTWFPKVPVGPAYCI